MKKGLLRVLGVRRLLEELSDLELQIKTAELRQLKERAQEHRGLAAEARREALARPSGEAATDSWLGMSDAEIFRWKSERMEAAAQEVTDEVVAVREQRMNRHIERQQAELLVSEAAQVETRERSRREQQRVDDWYQSLRSSQSRRSG
ncbi:MAG: hypothetical protein WAM56_04125 [Acidobacteriaceae bacterium]|jgi:hypothetical protein